MHAIPRGSIAGWRLKLELKEMKDKGWREVVTDVDISAVRESGGEQPGQKAIH